MKTNSAPRTSARDRESPACFAATWPASARLLLIPSLCLAAAFLLVPAASRSFPPLFDTWIGYDTGTYAAGRFPTAVATGDLDADGHPDLAVANWPWGPGFSILLNEADGTFGQPAHVPTELPPLGIAIADFDRDGRQDVAVPNSGMNWEGTTVSIFLGHGDGSFQPAQTFAAANGPIGLAGTDFDGDGAPDLAVAGWGGTSVALLRNDGAGEFLAPVAYEAGRYPYRLAAADLDGDSRPDLAVANEGQQIDVLINDGAGGFAAPTPYATGLDQEGGDFYPCVEVTDIDRDGDRDVLYSSTRTWINGQGAFALFRNQGNGTFAPAQIVSFGFAFTAGVVSLAAGDLSGDGWPDVVGVHFDNTENGGFFILRSDGLGGFLPGTRAFSGQTPGDAVPVNADGDDDLDLAVVCYYSLEAVVHENGGDGTFAPPPTYDGGGHHLDAADIDHDGHLDVATSIGYAYSGSVSVVRGRGDATFGPPATYLAPTQAYAVKLRDLDRDTFADLVWIDGFPPYWGRWRRNLGDGTFGPAISIPLPNCGSGDIDAIDLDGDLDLDIVATEEGACDLAHYIDIALNRGDGTFAPAYRVEIFESGPREVTGGDWNGDGRTDLAIAAFGAYGSNNKVVVLIGRGDGTFQPPHIYGVGQGPEAIVAADVNGDRVPDLATGNAGADGSGGETMSVLIGRGDGTFFPAIIYPGSYSPDLLGTTAIVAGDPDADGDEDLLVANYGSHDVSFYANRGDGTFEPQIRYGLQTGLTDLLLADFDEDGIEDLAGNHIAIARGLVGGTTAIEDGPTPAAGRSLLLAEPNPFNPRTTLRYLLPARTRVRLTIHDLGGRAVAILADGNREAGAHAVEWAGRDTHGAVLGSGVYFAHLVAGADARSLKLVLVK